MSRGNPPPRLEGSYFTMDSTSLHIERIPPDRLREAARLMASASSDTDAGDRFLLATQEHGVQLDEFWGVSDTPDGPLQAVALLVPSPGATAMVFTSPILDKKGVQRVTQLLKAACGRTTGVKLAQALFETNDTLSRSAFMLAGFRTVGELLYLRRDWSRVRSEAASPPLDAGVTIENWRQGDDDDLASALERSYIDTMDCPELCGLRDSCDVIASHRSIGEFDPTLWWIVRLDQQPAGALLLNPSPPMDHTELVYMGLAPELRGKGLASLLLRKGIASLAHRKCRSLTCAVDSRNIPARKLYERNGFREFSRRSAFVLPIAIAPNE